ncbi:MAG: type I restriction-modification system endonuclease [Candidatus Riflebacteria bacterium]|nr:type I restriction-modification system endonuclease [Candidatus Riflebacteria bacterium]
MPSNFEFLKKDFPVLANFGELAEKYLYSDSNSCLMKLGMIGETIGNMMFAYDNIPFPVDNTAVKRIDTLYREGLLSRDLVDVLHSLRKMRNKAVHENFSSIKAGKSLIQMAYTLCEWFMEAYGDCDYKHKAFVMPSEHPEQISNTESVKPPEIINITKEAKEAENKEDEKIAEKATQTIAETTQPLQITERKQKTAIASSHRYKSEAETRYMIDEQLRKVGWECDSESLRYSSGTRPQKNHNMAIAEWPTLTADGKKGFADYALFVDTDLVGIIEAKAQHKDVSSVIDNQCKDYASNIRKEDKEYVIGSWGKFKVPFIFATNGREYIKQFETLSGIWFQDLRDSANVPKALRGWFSPLGIKERLEADNQDANNELMKMPYDLLLNKDGLNLREYQLNAVKAAEKAIIEGKNNVLLAMATGTGKTRTVLGMIYRFLKSGRFKRILFLVDRNSLGEQASDVLKEVRLEDLMTLNNIYNIKGLEDKNIDSETRLQIATVQSMVKRIMYNEDEERVPSISDYDLLIIDEAHRGYILDKEMGEEESLFNDQRDYQSKYRAVVEYFDAVKIALTATPALQTTEIFGPPVFKYTYREAVIDGFLCDHDAPYIIKTELAEKGIHYRKGDIITIYDPVTGEVKNIENIPDEIDFDVDSFNSKVIVESFNETVLKEISKKLHPNNPKTYGKTLIYAVNDRHADLIVKILKEIYSKSNLPNEAIMKITGSIGNGNKDKIQQAIRNFKNEDFPSIAVTVDLLTTGIDVPEITSLVFLRKVRSRILYEQMLGRATRLCAKLNKTHFDIYDAVSTCEALQDFSTMKPVVVNPLIGYDKLLEQLKNSEEKKDTQFQINQIIGKLQRSRKELDEKGLEDFKTLSGGKTPSEFIAHIKSLNLDEAKKYLLESKDVFEFLKKYVNPKPLVISGLVDNIIEVKKGFGKNNSEESDYIEEFTNFIKSNMNMIPALNIVCTKPKELTRKSLRELASKLDLEGYSEQQLNSAISKMTNKEITADIISLIRRCAIGTELVSHEKRIKSAVDKLRNAHSFNSTELKWLERIEKALLKDNIMTVEDFDADSKFSSNGGFARINKAFNNRLKELIAELNEYLYEVA